jgi:DNA-binding transcriptional regulator YdaS (Cro superfamily)
MTLAKYLGCCSITSAAFARQVGVSKQAMFKYVHGLRIPAPGIMVRIREATDGAVTADDFVDQRHEAESRARAEQAA